jgi:hypothetical protein
MTHEMKDFQQLAKRHCPSFNPSTKDGCHAYGVCRLFRNDKPCLYFEGNILTRVPEIEEKYWWTVNPGDTCDNCNRPMRKRRESHIYCRACAREMWKKKIASKYES